MVDEEGSHGRVQKGTRWGHWIRPPNTDAMSTGRGGSRMPGHSFFLLSASRPKAGSMLQAGTHQQRGVPQVCLLPGPLGSGWGGVPP